MAVLSLANAKLLLPSPASPNCSSSSSASGAPTQIAAWRPTNLSSPGTAFVGRRSIFLGLTALVLGKELRIDAANAAVLEAEDDQDLLDKVMKDRKKRLERQGILRSSAQETGYLQDLVYRLSKIGQAIENNDLGAASSVLGSSKDTEWLKNVNSALDKFTSSDEQKTEVDAFNSSVAGLMSSVSVNDIEASKIAFVASATAFEKWTALAGLVDQLKGL